MLYCFEKVYLFERGGGGKKEEGEEGGKKRGREEERRGKMGMFLYTGLFFKWLQQLGLGWAETGTQKLLVGLP